MLKKEEVYVRVSSKKKARKLKDVLDMFKIEWHINQFENNTFYFENGSLYSSSGAFKRTKVSLKELRNILAREYLKEGDVVFMRFGVYESILRVKSVDDEFINVDKEVFVKTSDSIYNSGKEPIKNFIRYATEEEKKLLKPQESVIDKAISLLHHGLGLDYSHEVIQGLEELKNK